MLGEDEKVKVAGSEEGDNDVTMKDKESEKEASDDESSEKVCKNSILYILMQNTSNFPII